MLRNTKSRGLRPSALQKKTFVLTGQENENIPTSALQGFCCTTCVYFRVVKLESGRVRKLCSFTGERLTLAGNPLCEFRRVEGGAA